MNSTLIRGRALVALLGTLALASASQAQSPNDDDIRQTVVRVAYLSGEVSYSRGDDPDDWQPASLNFPMTLGDRLYTARGSRLELQTEGGAIYLAPETDLAALNLTYEVKQFSLGMGSASFRIRQIGSGESFEVDTPNAAVTFDRAGEYRINVDRDGNTRVIVNRGHAYVAAAGGEVPLEAGRLMAIDGIDSPVYDITSLPRPDSWDQWVATRSRPSLATGSRRYVNADISGVDDLDQYGRWSEIPEYGRCWSPANVSADWQPYRAGRWAWQDPWGWSWVSNESWGWAPYHYGRWVTSRVALVLGTGRAGRPHGSLRAGARRVRRRARLLGLRLGRRRRERRLVPAGAPRPVRSVVGLAGPRNEPHQRHERHLREPHVRDGGQPEHVRFGRAGREEHDPRREGRARGLRGARRPRPAPGRAGRILDPRVGEGGLGASPAGRRPDPGRGHASRATPGASFVPSEGEPDPREPRRARASRGGRTPCAGLPGHPAHTLRRRRAGPGHPRTQERARRGSRACTRDAQVPPGQARREAPPAGARELPPGQAKNAPAPAQQQGLDARKAQEAEDTPARRRRPKRSQAAAGLDTAKAQKQQQEAEAARVKQQQGLDARKAQEAEGARKSSSSSRKARSSSRARRKPRGSTPARQQEAEAARVKQQQGLDARKAQEAENARKPAADAAAAAAAAGRRSQGAAAAARQRPQKQQQEAEAARVKQQQGLDARKAQEAEDARKKQQQEVSASEKSTPARQQEAAQPKAKAPDQKKEKDNKGKDKKDQPDEKEKG